MGIQLKKNTYENILQMFYDSNENTEIECKIDVLPSFSKDATKKGKAIYYSQFQRVLSYASKAFKPSYLQTDVVHLDIHAGQYRMTIAGSENIQFFCKNRDILSENIGSFVSIMTKNRKKKEILDEYDISVKMSDEREIYGDELKDAVSVVLGHKNHTYRIKNRYFMLLPNSNLRFDFTIVKSHSNVFPNLVECLPHMKLRLK